jgi:hypothetical protein
MRRSVPLLCFNRAISSAYRRRPRKGFDGKLLMFLGKELLTMSDSHLSARLGRAS